jgi:rhodanese-related sulfurtransferase
MKQLQPGELKVWMEEHKVFTLLDVREQWEHEAYNIGGAHIPVGEIIARKNEIDKDSPIVVYCEKGIRSSIVIQRLEALGYSNLINLTGGMYAWKKSLPENS